MKARIKKFSVIRKSADWGQPCINNGDFERTEQLAELGVTGKAFSILEVISLNKRPTTIPEIIQATRMTKPTAHRVVSLLVDMGFLERDIFDRGFIEGARLVGLAYRTVAAAAPRSLRHAVLQGMSELVGETCNYGILSGGEVVYLDRVEGKWPLGLRFEAGSRVPAHCTAIGKLMLSCLAERELLSSIEAMPRPSYTDNTITETKALQAALEKIRRDGIGTDNQEFMHGVVCVAVPVIGQNECYLGGVAISAPEARMTLNQILNFVPQMKDAASKISTTYLSSKVN
jgi:DNA-binding IclR family transcriptional regulator